MVEIVIIGAGIAGLGAALGLDAHGHSVTIVEQDGPAPTTSGDEAFDVWDRRSVPQFRQAHTFSARSRSLLMHYAPGVVARLTNDGIGEANMFKMIAPPEVHEPQDDEFTGFTTRRPAFELALRHEAESRPNIRFECPATVAGLSFASQGPPPVVDGVRLADKRVLRGDVVLDAAGRRSRVVRWLEEVGVTIAETVQDCGLTYFTRYFRRSAASPLPLLAIFGIRTRCERLLILGFTGDHDTYAITMAAASWDDDLRSLRHDWAWNAVATGLTVTAPWMDPDNGTALHPVATMPGHRNVLRHFMPSGEPAVLGLLPIGDALCTTNPSRGWGASMALTFAFAACEAINADSGDLTNLAHRYARTAVPEADGVYLESAAADRIRGYRWRDEPIPDHDREDAERQSLIEDGVLPGIRHDVVLARAFLRQTNLIESPRSLFDNPEVLARAQASRERNRARVASTPPISREHILELIAAARP